jgi:hypothetical protein
MPVCMPFFSRSQAGHELLKSGGSSPTQAFTVWHVVIFTSISPRRAE